MVAGSDDALGKTFERALEDILARVFSSTLPHNIGIAYSGGLDSTVLLHLAAHWARSRPVRLHALHVHHGLSPHAEAWMVHARQTAALLNVSFDAQRVIVADKPGGVEQAARTARYAALGAMCSERGIALLLTAHHQDDQAETTLLQLLRGAGLPGLAAMERAGRAPALLGQDFTVLARPLLDTGRPALQEWAQHAKDVAWVEDESNADPRYKRNRLRHQVMPMLDRIAPGFQRRLVRSASHAAAAQELLTELAREDLARCCTDDGLAVQALCQLSVPRANNLLRHWFVQHGMRPPSTAWLDQLRLQIFAAAADAQVRVVHPDCEVWRYRDRLLLARRIDESMFAAAPVPFRWQGEGEIEFAHFGGRLVFETVGQGLAPQWLSMQSLRLAHRSGGERLRLASNRPSRDLKHHFQALGIPPWQRRRLPLVWADATLLYAAGIGHNHASDVPMTAPGVQLTWKGTLPLPVLKRCW